MLPRFFPVLRKIPTKVWLVASMGLYFVSLWLVCLARLNEPIYGFVCLGIPLLGAFFSMGDTFLRSDGWIVALLWLVNPWLLTLWVSALVAGSLPPEGWIKPISSLLPIIAWVAPTFLLGIVWATMGYVPQLGAFLWVFSIGFAAEAAWNSRQPAFNGESVRNNIITNE